MKRHAVLMLALLLPAAAHATPSTVFWAPSTPYVQPFGKLHVTYDTYFGSEALYPVDAGLTIGVLPWPKFQAEVGFDVFYPTYSSGEPMDAPVLLNAKVGSPEGALFERSPGWSAGVALVGFEENVTDYNMGHLMLGMTFPRIGTLSAGGYYGGNENLYFSSTGDEQRSGFMGGWMSPAIDVPSIDKIMLCWDIQTGENVLGATGGGVYVYFTPDIDLIMGPVFFFDEALQPGGSSWMWTLQFDADLDLFAP